MTLSRIASGGDVRGITVVKEALDCAIAAALAGPTGEA